MRQLFNQRESVYGITRHMRAIAEAHTGIARILKQWRPASADDETMAHSRRDVEILYSLNRRVAEALFAGNLEETLASGNALIAQCEVAEGNAPNRLRAALERDRDAANARKKKKGNR